MTKQLQRLNSQRYCIHRRVRARCNRDAAVARGDLHMAAYWATSMDTWGECAQFWADRILYEAAS